MHCDVPATTASCPMAVAMKYDATRLLHIHDLEKWQRPPARDIFIPDLHIENHRRKSGISTENGAGATLSGIPMKNDVCNLKAAPSI
jgi:hypothetical protein